MIWIPNFSGEGSLAYQKGLERALISRDGRLYIERINTDGSMSVTEYTRDRNGRLEPVGLERIYGAGGAPTHEAK
jgi:hypothetical protein